MMIFRNQICAFLNLSSVLLIVFGMLSSNCMATDSEILKINFDEFYGDFGPYYNDKIQMDNFHWVNENFNNEYYSYYHSAIKSPPNFGYNVSPRASISCPGGSFDIISMCITDSWTGDAQAAPISFNGTLAHDDGYGISIEYEQGAAKFPDPFTMKCLDFNRGFRDLSSVTISSVYYYDGNWQWRYVAFDDIKLRINRPCNVDSPTNVASSHIQDRQPSFRIKNEILSGQTGRSP